MNLSAMLESPNCDMHFPRLKIPFQLFANKSSSITSFLDNFISIYSNMIANYTHTEDNNDNNDDFSPLQLQPSKITDSCFLLLKTINDLTENNYKMSFPRLNELFNIELLNLIMTDLHDRTIPTNKTKVSLLNYYRIFTLEPELSNKNNNHKYLGYGFNENSSFMHRLLLLDQSEKFTNLGVTKEKLFLFLNKLSSSIVFLHEKIDDSVLFDYVREMLKYYCLIIDSAYFDITRLERISDNLFKVLFLVKEKKEFTTIIADLEYLVYNILLFKNDYVLRTKIKLTDIDSAYEANSNKKNSNFNLNLNINLLGSNNNNLKYAFENSNSFNLNLIKLLFTYTPDNVNSCKRYLRNDAIYDLLVFSEDYYLEALSNMTNSEFKIFNDSVNEVLLKQISNNLVNKLLAKPMENSKKSFFFRQKEDLIDDESGFNLTSLTLKVRNVFCTGVYDNIINDLTGLININNNNNNNNNIQNASNSMTRQNLSTTLNDNASFNHKNNDYLIKLLNENLDFDYYSVLGVNLTDFILKTMKHIHNLTVKYLQVETFNEKKFLLQALRTIESVFTEVSNEMKSQGLAFTWNNYDYKNEVINKAFREEFNHNYTLNYNNYNNNDNNDNYSIVEKENDAEKEKEKNAKKSLLEINTNKYKNLPPESKLFIFQVSLFKIGLFDKIMELFNTIIQNNYIMHTINLVSSNSNKVKTTNTNTNNTNTNTRITFKDDLTEITSMKKVKQNDKDSAFILEYFTEIEKFVFGINDLITEENPFLAGLLLNRILVKRFLRSEGNLYEKLNYYKRKLIMFKEKNYKVDCQYFIRKILKLTNYYIFAVDPQLFQIVLEVFKLSIDVSLEKTKRKILEKVVSEINIILNNQIFISEIQKQYHLLQVSNKAFLNNKLKTSYNSNNITNNNSNNNNNNTNNLKNEGKSVLIFNEVLEDAAEWQLNELETILKNVLLIVNSIPNEYFMLLTESLPIDVLSAYISCHYSIHPELKIQIIETYTRFLLNNNYFIQKNPTSEYFSINLHELDVNLIGRIEPSSIINNLEALTLKSQSLLYKQFDYIAENNGFNPVIESLELFISTHARFKSLFNLETDFFLEYFETTVLKPSILCVYKLLFYSKTINAQTKYQIYKFVYLFTANCKYFFENVNVNDLTKFSNAKKLLIASFNPEQFISIKSFKDDLLEELSLDTGELNSRTFDHLNLELTFCIFFKYIRIFSIYKDLCCDYLFNFQSLIEEHAKKNNEKDGVMVVGNESNLGQSGNNFFNANNNSVSKKPSFFVPSSNSKPKKNRYNELQEDLLENEIQLGKGNSGNINAIQIQNIGLKDSNNFRKDHSSMHSYSHHTSNLKENNKNTKDLKSNFKPDGSKINLLIQELEEESNNSSETFYFNLTTAIEEYKNTKEDYFNTNIMNELFLNDSPEFHYVKKTIVMDIFNKLKTTNSNKHSNKLDYNGDNQEELISLFPEANLNMLEIVNKLFKTEPHIWQEVIPESENAREFLEFVIEKQLFFTQQFIFTDFCRHGFNREKNTFYTIFLQYIEFLRLTCEDHNKIYQTLLINNYLSSSLKLTSFIFSLKVQVLKYLDKYLEKVDLLRFFRNEDTSKDYFDDLSEKLTDFLIEIIQGAISYNFDKITTNKEFQQYVVTYYKYFDNLEKYEEYESHLFQFMRFINCYFEENSNSIDNKNTVIKRFNAKKLQSLLLYSFKKLHYCFSFSKSDSKNDSKNDNKNDINNSNKNNKNNNFSEKILEKLFTINSPRFDKAEFLLYHIPNTASNELIKQFISKEDFTSNPLFNFSICAFMILKRAANWRGGEKYLNIINNLRKQSEIETSSNAKNIQSFVIKKETYIFFDKLIKEVEISFSIDDVIEESILRAHKHLFSKEMREHYDKLVDNSNNKKNVLDSVVFLVHPDTLFIEKGDREQFIQIAPYDHFNEKLNFFIDYFDSYRNKLLMRKILWETESWVLNKIYSIDYHKMEILSAMFSLVVNIMMLLSVYYKDTVRDIINFPFKQPTLHLAFFHNILLVFLILNWYLFKVFETLKFEEIEKGYWGRFTQFAGLLFKSDILPFIWNLFFGTIALVFSKYRFLLALQLFPIFNIVPTMSSVLFAVRIRYKQFASTAYMLIILVFCYTAVTYYNFSSELIDSNNNAYCQSFKSCFIYLINYGVRGGSGIGFPIKTQTEKGFWSEFLFDWVFYFTIILTMLNIINGIIVDTFQELREKNNERDNKLMNECYICSLNRSNFEIKGISYDNHVEHTHNVVNYYVYLSKVLLTDEHDLNSLDLQVLLSFRQKKIDFFPIKKTKSLS